MKKSAGGQKKQKTAPEKIDREACRIAVFASWGMGWKEIAGKLRKPLRAITEWRRQNPQLNRAYQEGRRMFRENEAKAGKTTIGAAAGVPQKFTKNKTPKTFQDIVYERLPEDLQRYWDRITAWEDDPNASRRIDAMLNKAGDNVRKALFLKAFQYHNFKVSPACRFVGIGRQVFNNWRKHDLDFLNMVATMEECKGDFFEEALINQIIIGNPNAVIFANKTFNKNRGYGERMEMEVKGQINHSVTVLREEDLELIPLEYRKKLLEAIQSREQTKEITVESMAG